LVNLCRRCWGPGVLEDTLFKDIMESWELGALPPLVLRLLFGAIVEVYESPVFLPFLVLSPTV
jgi:hypothetical protein